MQHIICSIINILIFMGLLSASAWAQTVHIQSPSQAAQGAPFEVLLEVTTPTPHFTVLWRDNTITIPSENTQRSARILLSVPLDAPSGTAPLTVSTAQGATATHAIRILTKARPVQRLTVDSKFVDPPADVQARIARDRQKITQVLAQFIPARSWSVPFVRPVPGEISSQFGLKRVLNGKPRKPHRGLDFRGKTGQPIHALADGQVALAEDLYYSGKAVYVNHGGGVFSSYLHMSEIVVQPGQAVRRGTVLGLVGSTGVSTAPHLHLGLIVQGTAADPLPLLEASFQY